MNNHPALKRALTSLKNPTVFLSVLSQVLAILILLGVNINEQAVMSIVGMGMSILASLGIISKVDLDKAKLEVADFYCKTDQKVTQHVKINGRWVCTGCGEVYEPPEED